MTEVAQRLPHGQERMRYTIAVRDRASITECAVTDDGEMRVPTLFPAVVRSPQPSAGGIFGHLSDPRAAFEIPPDAFEAT